MIIVFKTEKKCKNRQTSYEKKTNPDVPYYMKFSRHVYFEILMGAYLATLKFRDFAKILYFESL